MLHYRQVRSFVDGNFEKNSKLSMFCFYELNLESELILSIAKLADQIGHQTNVILSNSSKKNVSTSSSSKFE